MIYIKPQGPLESTNICGFKLKSADDAKAFVEKFNGLEMENNAGKVTVVVHDVKSRSLLRSMSAIQSVKIKITNLVHRVTEKQLTHHIVSNCKLSPKLVDIR